MVEAKHKLIYNDDGSFRVMIIADAHMNLEAGASKIQDLKDRISVLVDRIEPSLIIFTGDNTMYSGSEEKLRANIDALVSYIEEKRIPWCHVYGNHDHEHAISKQEQQKIYESYEYCVSKTGDDISGTGNYALGIYKKDGSLGSVIYCLDSGSYDSVNGGYDYIKDDQIEWYKSTSEALQRENGGRLVPGVMAFHIPLKENNDAFCAQNDKKLVYETTGIRNEGICSSKTRTNLFEVAYERGDIKAIVTGHDHINDYMYNYRGIKLCASPNVGDLTYTNLAFQGARVIDMSLDLIDNIKTHVEYVIKRVDGSGMESLDTNVVLFDGATLPSLAIEGYDNPSYNGDIEIKVAEEKGVSRNSAYEITRSQSGNFEINFMLDSNSYGKVGKNEYLVAWMDLTGVDFRKACFGILSTGTTTPPFRTDDNDRTNPKYYYLPDGTSEWIECEHGGDGCFGYAENSSVNGLKGYFAFKIFDFKCGGVSASANTPVTGVYFYADIGDDKYAGIPFYIDNVQLTADLDSIQ